MLLSFFLETKSMPEGYKNNFGNEPTKLGQPGLPYCFILTFSWHKKMGKNYKIHLPGWVLIEYPPRPGGGGLIKSSQPAFSGQYKIIEGQQLGRNFNIPLVVVMGYRGRKNNKA